MEFLQDMEDTELMAGLGPEFGQERRVEVRAVGDHDLGREPPRLEVLEEPPHVVGVIPGDQGEGHRQVLERVGGQQQGHPAEVQLVDAEGAAEAVQDPAAMVGQVEPPGLPVEAVVDEAVGEVQEEVPPHRGDDPLDAHAVVEDAIEDGPADLVVVGGLGLDVRRGGAEGLAAGAAGPVLAVGDVEEGDLLVGDGADQAVVGGLAWPELAAVGAWGLGGCAADGYGADVGPSGLHGLRAPVGLGMHPPARRP